jgi:hypothetical protein
MDQERNFENKPPLWGSKESAQKTNPEINAEISPPRDDVTGNTEKSPTEKAVKITRSRILWKDKAKPREKKAAIPRYAAKCVLLTNVEKALDKTSSLCISP